LLEIIGQMAVATEPEHHVESDQKVTPLELFFDLVFVFAITQVTTMLSHDPTWGGLVRGLLVLSALWWAWAAYSWLTNSVNAEEGLTRAAMIAATAATLVASLCVPGAFGEDALVFGLAYAVVRLLHIVVYIRATPDAEVEVAMRRMAPGFVVFSGLLIAASFFDGTVAVLIWAVALIVHVIGLWMTGVKGWKVHPAHFAERHGAVVIIALGESIVSVGVGAAGLPVRGQVIGSAVLGTAIAAALWWSYFDVAAIVAERRLRAATGEARARMARDSYTYLHLPMVAGIVLLALGIKKTVGHGGDALDAMPAFCLCGGVAMYLLAHVAFRWRNTRIVGRRRIATALICVALFPLGTVIPSLATLALVACAVCLLVGYEAVRFAPARARIRHATE
jgi:low temperature requirement protein LtrA